MVCGEGSLDEISICGPTRVSHLKNNQVRTFELTPEELGFQRADLEAIRGGDAAANARIIRSILEGRTGAEAGDGPDECRRRFCGGWVG